MLPCSRLASGAFVMRLTLLVGVVALALATATMRSASAAPPLPVVSAENFYGNVVSQIGGPDVAVMSILANPSEDPHLFEASAGTARAIAGARLVIYNGIGYDEWIARLLAASPSPTRQVVAAAVVTR